jgi:hypothetical protein
MLSVWVPSTANRVYGVVRSNHVNFGLNVAAAIVLPLQGFFNTLIYLFTSRRELLGALKRRCGREAGANRYTSAAEVGKHGKDVWHRPESREELVVVQDEDEGKEFGGAGHVEDLRFPWQEEKEVLTSGEEVV